MEAEPLCIVELLGCVTGRAFWAFGRVVFFVDGERDIWASGISKSSIFEIYIGTHHLEHDWSSGQEIRLSDMI